MPIKSKLPSRKYQFAILFGVIAAFIAFGALYRASSQGDSSDTYPKGFRGGACTIETEALTIGYSGYYLPQDYESPADTIRSPYVPVQCGKVPEPASLNISIDLLYPESARDFLLALRLVKTETDDKKNSTERQILSIPAQQHQSGVITAAFKLNEPGQYILYLEGKDAENTDLQVKIPMQVGFDWKNHLKNSLSPFLKKD
jgi:hypothetical protein